MATGMWQNAINNINLPALGFGLGMMQAAQPSPKPANFGNDMQAGIRGAEGMAKLKGLLGKMGQAGGATPNNGMPTNPDGINPAMQHGFMNNPMMQRYHQLLAQSGYQAPQNGFSLGMTPRY